jgi:hypothetical protein
MKVTTHRAFVVALFAVATAAVSSAEDYQCRNEQGCIATITKAGVTKKVLHRKGDIVQTESGWVVDTDDGWVKVREKPNF